jgi:hypothetical protein
VWNAPNPIISDAISHRTAGDKVPVFLAIIAENRHMTRNHHAVSSDGQGHVDTTKTSRSSEKKLASAG